MIAVPITAENAKQAIEDIKVANSKADIIELRLDFLKQANETVLKQLLFECKKPVIVTIREKSFGEGTGQEKRMQLLEKAIEFGAAYIDLDFNAGKAFFNNFKGKKAKTKIILSYHNFKETPALQELSKLLKEMRACKTADILKIVTNANDDRDNDTILSLLHEAKSIEKLIIAFCMGKKGKRSRIECIKAGAMLTFASLSVEKESAVGQLTVEEMRKALKK